MPGTPGTALRAPVALGALLICSGCGGAWTGRKLCLCQDVSYDGQPVLAGTILFSPTSKEMKGRLCGIRDGKFDTKESWQERGGPRREG